jgi:hypothetical protein
MAKTGVKSRYEALLHEICVGQGWCGSFIEKPLHVDDFIPETGPVTADQFIDWVFQAEGIDLTSPDTWWLKHAPALRDAFVRHMGGDVVDASELKWEAL